MRTVIVGAGISGLAAARRLQQSGDETDEVVVLEGSHQVGGKLCLAEVGGVQVDVGAEAMLNRRPEAVDLARAAGLGEDLRHPTSARSAIWSGGAMHALPPQFLGVPTGQGLAGLLSPDEVATAQRERVLAGFALAPGDDIGLGELVARRFGDAVNERLVEPLLGGVYAGHAREISLRAAHPALATRIDGRRTLTEIAEEATGTSTPAGPPVPVFAGLCGGVGRLPQALSAALDVRTTAMVRRLSRTPDGWRLEVGPARDPEWLEADAVVLAVPPASAARLLAGEAPLAAAELAAIETASIAVVTVAVPAGLEVPGSGFLVPPRDGRTIKAATFSFAKWGWVDAASDLRLLRCSIGRHREERVLQVDDEELVAAAVHDLAAALGTRVKPVDSHVQRWGGALPQYAVGHLERVRRVREEVARIPGLTVCGAAYDGVGIAACVASAERAAVEVSGRPATG